MTTLQAAMMPLNHAANVIWEHINDLSCWCNWSQTSHSSSSLSPRRNVVQKNRHGQSAPETWRTPLLPELLQGNVWVHGQEVRLNSSSLRCPQWAFLQLNPCFRRILEKQAHSCQHFSSFQIQSLISELHLITNSIYSPPATLRRVKMMTLELKCVKLGGRSSETAPECVRHSMMCLPGMQTMPEVRTGWISFGFVSS